jgi:hypothetical protein
MHFYLELCIWPVAILHWFRESNSEYASYFVQIPEHGPYTENPNSLIPKKARQVKNKAKSMLIIIFDTKGIVCK